MSFFNPNGSFKNPLVAPPVAAPKYNTSGNANRLKRKANFNRVLANTRRIINSPTHKNFMRRTEGMSNQQMANHFRVLPPSGPQESFANIEAREAAETNRWWQGEQTRRAANNARIAAQRNARAQARRIANVPAYQRNYLAEKERIASLLAGPSRVAPVISSPYVHNFNANTAKWRSGVASGIYNVAPRPPKSYNPTLVPGVSQEDINMREAQAIAAVRSYAGSQEEKRNKEGAAFMRNYYAREKANRDARERAWAAAHPVVPAKPSAAMAEMRAAMGARAASPPSRTYGPAVVGKPSSRKYRRSRKNRR
jgi:hypothetical protein